MPAFAGPAFPLKMSANKRYLVDSNNVPCLLMGDSPQALFVKLSKAEAGLFLTNRAALGFNSLWVNLLCTTNNGGLIGGLTTNGIAPFTNTIPGTGKYDLTAPNEAYFAHVDYVVSLAAQLGIQILLDPLETSVDVWASVARTNGTNRCRAYGQYLGNRYKNFDNILWWHGNDFQDWTNAASDVVVRAVAQGIYDADPRHLHTLMLDYPVSGSLDNGNWSSLLGLNASYTYWPTYAQVLADYNRTNFIPTFMAEAHYEFEDLYQAYGTPEVMRRQAYWALLSGACGQLMGNHWTWQFLAGWQTNLNTVGSLQNTNVKSLFESRRWFDLVPDQNHTVVTSGYGTFATSGSLTNNNYATAARTLDGSLVMVYLPTMRNITVDMKKLSASASARWFDPVNGSYIEIAGSPFTNLNTRVFTPPGTNSGGVGDWVLVLEAQIIDDAPPVAPGSLEAVAVGLNQINLSWSPSTDNIGVAGYRVERCLGYGCDTFTQVATVTTNNFTDTSLASSTYARYRVAATDASTNISSYSGVASAATWIPAVAWSGLLAEYAFDEGAGPVAFDASGNANTGWLGGTAWSLQGRFGGAANFTGSSFVTVSNAASLNPTAGLAVEAWVWPAAFLGERATLLMKEMPGSAAYLLELNASNCPAFSVNTGVDGFQTVTSGSPLSLNAWVHLAGSYDGSNLWLYVNGVLVASNAVTGEIVASTGPLRFGGNLVWGGFFNGKADGVRLYNRPLAASEVSGYMNRASGSAPSISLTAAPQTSASLISTGFQLSLSANLPAAYVVETTTNFVTWESLATVEYTNGVALVTDPGAVLPEASFYRVSTAAGAPQVLLSSPAQSREELGSAGFRLSVSASAPAALTFERTTNFTDWEWVGSLNYTNGLMEFIDPPRRLPPFRFYRVRWP